MTIRKTPKIRKAELLESAIKIAEKKGYFNITRNDISLDQNVSGPLISMYLGDVKNVRKKILKTAIAKENLTIIAQAIALNDPTVKKLSEELKRRALNFLIK